jgi:hypothetical protein
MGNTPPIWRDQIDQNFRKTVRMHRITDLHDLRGIRYWNAITGYPA